MAKICPSCSREVPDDSVRELLRAYGDTSIHMWVQALRYIVVSLLLGVLHNDHGASLPNSLCTASSRVLVK